MSDKTAVEGGLATKMVQVMLDVDKVEKRGWNPQGAGYHYATDYDILNALRTAMAGRGLVVFPSVREYSVRTIQTRNGTANINTVLMDFTFVDAATGESQTVSAVGEGMDSGDKGCYKAMTGAVKYALLKTFLVPTGDDAEKPDTTDNQAPAQQTTGPGYTPRPSAPQQAASGAPLKGWTGSQTIEFGKFKGQAWASVDDSYLDWLVAKGTNPQVKDMAQAELKRRAEFEVGSMGDEVDYGDPPF